MIRAQTIAFRVPSRHRLAATRAELCRLIGLAPASAARLSREGLIGPRPDGRWSTRDVCATLTARNRERAEAHDARQAIPSRARDEGAPLDRNSTERLKRLRGDLLQRELDLKDGKLLREEEVIKAFGELSAMHRAFHLSLPSAVIGRIRGMGEAEAMEVFAAILRDHDQRMQQRARDLKVAKGAG